MSQNLHVFGLHVCPHCGRQDLNAPVLRVPQESSSWWVPWFLQKPKVEVEHLEVKCRNCNGTFQTLTFQQQAAVNNLRPYNDTQCVLCGGALNQRGADGQITDRSRMHEKSDWLHGSSCVLATCPYCHANWRMKLFTDTPNAVTAASRPRVPVPVTQTEPQRGLVDLPEIPDLRQERPLN